MLVSRFSIQAVTTTIVVCLLCGLAQGATVFVKAGATGANNGTSWGDAFTQVQPALNAAASGDEVWVAAGTYVENITLKDGVGLYGGFAGSESDLAQRDWATNETILDGNQAGSVVTSPSGATETSRIDGFTIRNGTGTFLRGYRHGGGVYCSSSSPTIANNTVTANSASSAGGIYCSFSSAAIMTNTIMGNSTVEVGGSPAGNGGGIYCVSSSLMIANNRITGNTVPAAYNATTNSKGGGIYCWMSSSATITGNTIAGNYAPTGGGIYCNSSSPLIANNTITGNSATASHSANGGGICCYDSSSTIANNTIAGNTAAGGGGICCSSSSPTIASNTIVGNTASLAGGGGILSDSSFGAVVNTIIAFNSSGVCIPAETIGAPTLRYNCVYENAAYNYSGLADPTGTDGNLSMDPRVASWKYGNWHIRTDSPCVDSGDDGAVQLTWLDMDGQPRTQGLHVDIGADESDGTVWPGGPYIIVRVAPEGDDAKDGSSWALSKRTVQAGIDKAAGPGGEVWAKAGTYPERITLRPFVHMYGGFSGTEETREQRDFRSNLTILDGQQAGSVVTFEPVGYRMGTIDGFTIRNGKTAYGGGGICCSFSSPTIANNTITGNTAYGGAGISCSLASPTIANNTIAGNSTTGGSGGGISCETASPTVTNNTISGNAALMYGGGVDCYSSSPTIANNTISGNIASSQGGGIYCGSSSPTIANTIIVSNSSGVYLSLASPSLLFNCVFGNTAYNYSGIADPTGTNGNISADPLFVGAGDLRLQPRSPCIDASDNAAVPADVLDLDGDGDVTEPMPFDLAGISRFLDDPFVLDTGLGTPPIVDMGAYEHVPTAPADFDDDGDVDADDLTGFQDCASGPGVPMASGCQAKDLDHDNDVDQVDFGLFQRCLSGNGVPADLACAN